MRGESIKVVIRYSVILILIFGFLATLVMSSLVKTIIGGLVLSYVFYPLYRNVNKRLKMKTISALLVTLFVLLLLIVPTFLIVEKLSTEVRVGFVVAKQYLDGEAREVKCEGVGICQLIPKNLKDADPKLKALLTNSLGKGTEFVVNITTKALLALPSLIFNLFIMFFIMYYVFKDGTSLVDKVKQMLPLRKQRQEALISQFNEVATAVIHGTVIVAIIQGVLAGLGFYLFGVPSPVTWGIITFVVSLVPFLGAFIIWLPASLLIMFNGYYSGDAFILLRGIGLFIYGMLLISSIDNILKPRIIGKRANIHPALVFLGIVGGVNFFGIVGVIVGPVIIAMLKTALDTYVRERSIET